MKGKILALLAAGLIAGPLVANASPGYTPVDFTGTLDVTCVGYGMNCGTGGVVPLFGSVSSSGVIDIGVAGNPDLFAGTLTGRNKFTGVADSLNGDVYDWTFTHTFAPGRSSILGDWSGTGIPAVIGSGGNGATELAQIVITSATPAPEIDPASAAGGLALLVGGLLVLRGRKRHIVAG
jgi:hypothetical protein